MKKELAMQAAEQGDDDAIRAILTQLCDVTQMGFAAVARVTEDRWIACQVLDKIDFGLEPGAELDMQMTICKEIRQTENYVVIDHVDADIAWQKHPVPIFYGFKSYVSFPVILADGSFYGTLCAIDPAPRLVSEPATIAAIEGFARDVGVLLSARILTIRMTGTAKDARRPQAG
ncbi:GAF domain-containing protein [Sphingobium sp. AR-3-1]|uniref:GAF domain-containing protein n=1 Tax=Sphingobium psychrophilum TaxID=2728834 RepID=A0A7X9WVL4_9SPHN|nr:GAF domain-containing protein [Sphingobium psychrophilum]NML10722.1 GAF domain-containing protein [Sphingobium psychrophilum]